jgi:hypothetical protein
MPGALRSRAPLRLRHVDYSDPFVAITGEAWALGLACRVSRRGDVLFSWDDPDVERRAWDLIGHSIKEVRRRSADSQDPVFVLTGDLAIEVYADTELDPWVLHLRDDTFVGSLSGDDVWRAT